MGAGASTIADYKEAASKSDESSFPEAFAQLKTAVDGFEGDAAAALAYAEDQCKALSLKVTLQSDNGEGKLYVTGGGGEAPAEEAEPSNEELEKISNEVALELLEAKTQSIVCLTDGSNNAHKAFEVAKALRKDDDVLSVVHIKSDKDYHDATTNFKSDQIQLR